MANVTLITRPEVGTVVAGHFITAVEGNKVWGISMPYQPDAESLARWVAFDKKSIKERNEIRRTDFSAAFIPGIRFATIKKS